MEQATFGAGCFWGVEAAFRKVPGVSKTQVGYMGGSLDKPRYEDVITKRTGHVEVVQITFDPAQVGYSDLLKVFWFIHDPTQADGQGNDIGSQYRSVIFVHSQGQKEEAEPAKAALEASREYSEPVVTSIEPAGTFWPAEDYHQLYLEKNPSGYCHVPLGNVAKFIANGFKK